MAQNAQQRRRNAPAKKNIVRRGQRAVLNGKPVVADGKGNWRVIPKGSAGNGIYTGPKAGSYKVGEDRKRTPAKSTTPSSRSTMGKLGVIQGDKSGGTKAQQEISAAKERTAAVKARAAAKAKAAKTESTKAPAAPKLPPRPSAPKAAPKKESSSKLTPMQQWAKAHPELAKKIKKGQSGAKELKIGRSTKPRNWLEKNYKPGKKK